MQLRPAEHGWMDLPGKRLKVYGVFISW